MKKMPFELTEKQISRAEVNSVAGYFEHIEIHTDTGEYFAGRSGIVYESQKELMKWGDDFCNEHPHQWSIRRFECGKCRQILLSHFGVKEEE